MKKFKAAAIAIALSALVFVSCDWFKGNKKHAPAFSITGSWNLDTMYSFAKDSNKNAIIFLALGLAKDSVISFEFKNDSTWNVSRDSISARKYFIKDSTLHIQEDSAFVPYVLSALSDSGFMATSPDSLVYVLSRKK